MVTKDNRQIIKWALLSIGIVLGVFSIVLIVCTVFYRTSGGKQPASSTDITTVVESARATMAEALPGFSYNSQDSLVHENIVVDSGVENLSKVTIQSSHRAVFQTDAVNTKHIDEAVLVEALKKGLAGQDLSYQEPAHLQQAIAVFKNNLFQCLLQRAGALEYSFACSDTQAISEEVGRVQALLAVLPDDVASTIKSQGVALVSRTQTNESRISGALIAITYRQPEQDRLADKCLFGNTDGTWQYIGDLAGKVNDDGVVSSPELQRTISEAKWNGVLSALVDRQAK